jgi:hypothetical protein
LSKPSASRGWVCALCTVPVLTIVAIALLASSPARHHKAALATAGDRASQPVTPAVRGRVQANFAALPLAFEENKGQTDAQVEYMARGNGYTLFLTASDAVFSLSSASAANRTSSIRRGTQLQAKNLPKQSNTQKDSTAVVRMQVAGGNALAKVSASGQLPGKSNYFIGNDPSKWQEDVAHYARVSYQDVYPGINLAFHGAQRQVEFDFVIAAGANPAPIGFHFTGAQRIKTDVSGNLVVSSAAGDVLLHKPVAYQDQNGARQPVDAQFALKANNQVSFELGNYDHTRELVIDPSVSYLYSTYLGGSGDDEGQAIAFDSTSAAYVTGETASANFPGASNSLIGSANVFVTKIAPDGSSLDYSTYIGGHGTSGDSGNAIAVNLTSGVAYVAGGTTSSDFPATGGAFQTTLKGEANAFVCELGPTGARTYCTYLGGTGTDTALGIALASDSSGDVYVVGKTSSTNFPTSSPLQGSLGSGNVSAGFVTKLNSTGTAPLLFSTYLGGSSTGDLAGAVAVGPSNNNVYVTGQTFSTSFPTTAGVYQTACRSCTGGNSNAFVTGINPTGSAYIYSTFLGGNSLDTGDGIAVDSTGSAYVTGSTNSTNFPTSSGAFQTTYGGGNDAFVTKLKADGSAPLVYSTFLGGSGFDAGASIGLDSSNNAYITGQTNSSPFPTVGATQSALGGGFDAFVSEINSSGTALVFSTYLGGSGDEDDGGNYGAVAVDNAGASIYVTGNTVSTNFPTQSPYPYSGGNANGGGNDAFVVKYSQPTTPSFTLGATTPSAVSPGSSGSSTVTLTADNGYSSAVNMTCSVSGSGSPLPACSASSFSTNPVTPTSSGATTTLTITTTGASAATFVPRNIFYAMGLPILGLSLVGMSFGSSGSRRKKLLGFLMIATVMGTLSLMPACGGGSGGGGGGGGGGGCTGCTTAGSYTVTITGTGTDASATTQSTQVTLKVN